MTRILSSYHFAVIVCGLMLGQHYAGSSLNAAEEPGAELSLSQALQLVMERHPGLKAAALDVEAAEGRAIQAGARPNPEVSFVAENFGNNKLQGFDGPADTIQLQQTIEIGGKRGKRIRVAEREKQLAVFDLTTRRLDLQAETTRRFLQVLAAQERVTLDRELVGLAGEFLNAVSARVRAGKVSPMEETKATILLASQKIVLDQAQKGLETARSLLCALWADSAPRFQRAVGDLHNIPKAPPITLLTAGLSRNPDVVRWSVETEQRQAALRVEKAVRIPDLTVGGGIRKFNDTGDNAFVLGVSVPLPVFNRNQGAIREATARVAKADQERRAAEVRVATALVEAYNAYSVALIEVTGLKNEVLPKAQNVFDAVKSGYTQGKFMYLDVLDAQRGFFEAKGRHLDALVACHKAIVEIERLVNENLAVQTKY